jgi:bifunctional enzyme CysN/CysC
MCCKIQTTGDTVKVSPKRLSFAVRLNGISKEHIFAGREYRLLVGLKNIKIHVVKIKSQLEIENAQDLACIFSSDEVEDVHQLLHQYFILIHPDSGLKIATGRVEFFLHRSQNISNQTFTVDRESRSVLNHHKACCVWFTGLSGSGKSTLANALEIKLHQLNKRTYILDGDNLRHGLNYDLGFTEADRIENIRRVSEVARLMVDAGLIVLVTLISPFIKDRRMAREKFNQGDFIEVFMDTPLALCESRDPKGLYKKSRSGEIKNFTGIDSPYESPIDPEVVIDGNDTIEISVDKLMNQFFK